MEYKSKKSVFVKAETVAYAAHCQQEDELDRPVAGHTNICPGAIKKPVSQSHRE